MHQSRAIMGYAERVAELSNEEYTEVWDAALEYNRRLSVNPNQWKMPDEELDNYEQQLNVDGTGNMGFVSIPKIDVNLPVYHGTRTLCCRLPSATLTVPRCLPEASTRIRKTTSTR